MWDDVTIGTGEHICSAVKIFSFTGDHDHSISQNSNCFWISGLYLDCGMRIFKDTPEGKKLSKFAEEKADIHVVLEWLNEVLLENIDREILKNRIDNALERSFEKGAEERAYIIRKALGI